MTAPIVPATLARTADGTPWSEAYGDVYHSVAGAAGQARHVFLDGNGLPARWQGRERFTILETGFGLGLNFLATWQAWKDDARRPARLDFVSVEKHPFRTQDLAELHAPHAALAALAAELRAAWPVLVPGVHRLEFERGRVVLTLALGDATELLPHLRLAADAIYLDGFTPSRNPDLWTPALLKRVARLAAPGATAATWSVATDVRHALEGAGFELEKRAGYGGKREMLVARATRTAEASPRASARRAIVIGAGMAGAGACERLAAHGWGVTLLEKNAGPAEEGSGNHAGTFHPLVTADDSVFARMTRAATLHWGAAWRALDESPLPPRWSRCGVLQLARDEREDDAQRRALETLGAPAEYAAGVDAKAASELAGMPVAAGGVWFPQSGWIRPPSLVRALLARCGGALEARYGCAVASLDREGDDWVARDAAGDELARAPVVVIATAHDALRLAPDPSVRLRRVRGQVSLLAAERFAALRAVVLRGGMVLPPVDGRTVVGASFDFDDEEPDSRIEDHEGNLQRLERILPGMAAGLDAARLEGRVGWRATVPDRLPMIGAIDDARGPGLYGAFAYGSRGLLWTGLGGELLASLADGNPLPLDGKLADAVAPGRFAKRARLRAGGKD